jgi:hypothetical protein
VIPRRPPPPHTHRSRPAAQPCRRVPDWPRPRRSKMSSTNVWTSEESGTAVCRCPESAISIDALRRSGYYWVNQLLQSPTLLRKRLLGKFKRIVEDWIIWSILDPNGFWINGDSKKDSKIVVKTYR